MRATLKEKDQSIQVMQQALSVANKQVDDSLKAAEGTAFGRVSDWLVGLQSD